MKLIINENQISMSAEQFLRQAGYAFHRDHRTGKESYARRLGGGFFPKFHMYVEENGDKITFNLHLDQKQASYEGSNMHSGEYDGEVVETEIERLRSYVSPAKVISPVISQTSQTRTSTPTRNEEPRGDMVNAIGGNRNYTNCAPKQETKPWWRFW